VEGGAFSLKVQEVQKALRANPQIKLVFLCSPGNPTGTLLSLSAIREVLETPEFNGIVVVDEAYIDFAGSDVSAVELIRKYSNLCVMQTLSKSFGLAAIRLGVAFAQPPLIQVLTNTKAPYNISTPAAVIALRALSDEGIELMKEKVATLSRTRQSLISSLKSLAELGVGNVIGTNNANFVLVPILQKGNGASGAPDTKRAAEIYRDLAEERGVVVRFRGNELGCAGCVRITIGTVQENETLLERLEEVLRRL